MDDDEDGKREAKFQKYVCFMMYTWNSIWHSTSRLV
jgi:hypothetical protein